MPKITDPALLAELNSPPPQTRVIGAPDPFKVRDQQRQDDIAAIAARSADRQDANLARQAQNDAAKLEFDRQKFEFEQAQAAAKNNLSPKERADAIAGYKAGDALDRLILDIEDKYNIGPGKTSGIKGLSDYLPLPRNERFNSAGNAARGIVGQALGFTGGQLNSVQEAQMAVGPYLPQSSDGDQTILDKIKRLRQLAQDSRDRSIALLGGKPDELGKISNSALQAAPQASPRVGATFNAAPAASLATGKTASSPIPPEMQAEYDRFVAANRGRISPEDYAQFRIEQNQKYGFGFQPGDVQEYINEAKDINDPANNINTNIPPPERTLGDKESALTGFAGTGVGASLVNYLNSATLGLPGAIAGNEKLQAVQNASPVGSFIGNVAGGLTGTAGLAKAALSLGAKSLPNALTGANLAYGGIVGAGNDTEDPLLGAAAGLGTATLGQGLGQFALGPALGKVAASGIANRTRGIFGARTLPKPPRLTSSERAVAEAIGGDGRSIATDLADARRLGVPMTLADGNTALRSLAGAAVRRSPDAKASAEAILEPRQASQIDRLQSALNRDLGAGANIPERSDALLRQARDTSRPLYDAAYASPGASSVDASGVLSTPTGKEALQKAYRAILDDQKDPTALGFDIDQAGEVALNRTPSFQALDYVKRSFDDIAQSGERNPITGAPIGNQAQTSAANSARELRNAIDAVNPDYAAARAAYAGPVGERESLNAGKAFARMTPDEMRFALERLSPTRQEQFRLGARSNLSDQADRVRLTSNPFEAVLGTPAAQQRVATLFPENAPNLIRQADIERALAKNKNEILGNSLTAERNLADQAFGVSPSTALAMDTAGSVAAGAPPVASAARLLGALSKDGLRMGFGKRRAKEIGDILFDEGRAVENLRSARLKSRQSSILGRKSKRRNRSVGSTAGGALAAPFLTDN